MSCGKRRCPFLSSNQSDFDCLSGAKLTHCETGNETSVKRNCPGVSSLHSLQTTTQPQNSCLQPTGLNNNNYIGPGHPFQVSNIVHPLWADVIQQELGPSHMEICSSENTYSMQLNAPIQPSKCLRCLAGEGGHINHIQS